MTRALKVLLLAAVCCGVLTVAPSRAAAAEAVIYAAGDIACDPLLPSFNEGAGGTNTCRQGATAALMVPGTFDAVLALGDVQYETATLSEFAQSYNPSWGRVKSVTIPVIGNHEGSGANSAADYCTYFGVAAHCNASGRQGRAAFYSVNVGDWHIVALNSNCGAAGGCGPGSPQYQWLQADLDANPRSCTLAAWHHPRWSSGYGGNTETVQPLWQLLWAKGADIVLAGHSHHYERFAPIDGSGAVNPDGMRSFVVGTGGANFTPINGTAKGSEVRQNTSFGLLRLALHPTSYDWSFVPVAGSTFTDAGSQSCRGVLPPPPPPPPAAPAAAPRGGPKARHGTLLARWTLGSARSRRVLLRGWIHIPARRWSPTVIRVRVGGRLAARRLLRYKHSVTVHLAGWSKHRRYRDRPVKVTIRRPL